MRFSSGQVNTFLQADDINLGSQRSLSARCERLHDRRHKGVNLIIPVLRSETYSLVIRRLRFQSQETGPEKA